MWKGSYTIEASVIMTVFFLILGSFIYITGYLHDSYVMENMAVAMNQQVLWEDQVEEEKLNELEDEYSQQAMGRTLFLKDIQFQVEASGGTSTTSYESKFVAPLWALYRTFLRGKLSGDVSDSYMKGEDFVRLCKGVLWQNN